jgi:pyruvate,orthophosphate dikinase
MLQCRVGKRNGPAAVRIAVEMYKEKLISAEEAVMRVSPAQLDELLHPVVDPMKEKEAKLIAKGLPAGPGGAVGQVVFTANDAVEWTKKGHKVILVREETNPEDVEGMRAAVGILTARGGMTSHAALVARGWGKCCIVGAGDIHIDYEKKEFRAKDVVVKEGDWITLNGTKGNVYLGQLPLIKAAEENPYFVEFMKLCNKIRELGVRTNADTPEDAKKARLFGAEGIGLFRTEHMFYGEGSEKPLFILRKMIVATNEEERRKALDELYPYMKEDIKKTLEVMEGLPVTVRLLDPPLHEFVPKRKDEREKLIKDLGITEEEFEARTSKLHEVNPMMGHRGVRLGISYPEVTEYQVRAILEAAAELVKAGKKAMPEIMIPVTCTEVCEFFSFGTNDLTQMGFGFSRDDIGAFLPKYLEKNILSKDPFQTIDFEGIGELIKIAIQKGRKVKPKLKIGICGEQGGDPDSVKFCYQVGMNYVSCSPYRVPLAILAAAQAVVEKKKKS